MNFFENIINNDLFITFILSGVLVINAVVILSSVFKIRGRNLQREVNELVKRIFLLDSLQVSNDEKSMDSVFETTLEYQNSFNIKLEEEIRE